VIQRDHPHGRIMEGITRIDGNGDDAVLTQATKAVSVEIFFVLIRQSR
jgi:hypothetical protein